MHPVPVLAALWAAVVGVCAADWPQYHGPAGNNASPETIRTNWSELSPQVVWRKPIGPGFSSLAVTGARVLTQARRTVNREEREVCLAYDVTTGNELWAADLDAAEYTNLSGYDDRMDGPRSTPSIDGDRVYVSTSQLKLFCLNLADGKVIWHRDFRADLGSGLIAWENAASPLVIGDLILLNSNAAQRPLTAVRKSDGTTLWSREGGSMTHATPVRGRIGGVDQVIFLTRTGLIAVVPETGDPLWQLTFAPALTSTASSPAVIGDYVYASSAYGSGTYMARVSRSEAGLSAVEAWSQRGTAYQAHWATPVVHESFLYSVPSPVSFQGRLACLDVVAGTNRWATSEVGSGVIGYGSVIKAVNVLIVLTEGGELVLVQPSPDAYREIDRFKVLEQFCWNHPTLANGRLYIRSTSLAPEMVALDVAPLVAAPLALQLGVQSASGPERAVRVTVQAADGQNLEPAAVDRVELVTSPRIGAAATDWVRWPQSFSLVDGIWTVELIPRPEPHLFLRLRETTAGP